MRTPVIGCGARDDGRSKTHPFEKTRFILEDGCGKPAALSGMGNARRRKLMEKETIQNPAMMNTAGTAVTGKHRTGRKDNVRYIAVTGVLSAIAFLLMLIEIPVPMLIPSFVKFDFSDLPALIGAFAMGPVCGILIELIKNLLHVFISGSFGVGELCNFMLGAVFAGVAGAVYGKNKTKKRAVIGSIAGAVSMALFSVPSNYFITYPFYYQFMPEETILAMYQAIIPSMKSILQSLLVFNMPFTFVKGMIDVLVTFLIYKKVSPLLHGRN